MIKLSITRKDLQKLSKLNTKILRNIDNKNLNTVDLLRRNKQEIKDKYNEGENRDS